MLDSLPKRIKTRECGVVNLDDSLGPGTHWVAYFKSSKQTIYFDSYGLSAPIEIDKYIGRPYMIQTFQLQSAIDVICGHLCVYVLRELNRGKGFKQIILNLFNIG